MPISLRGRVITLLRHVTDLARLHGRDPAVHVLQPPTTINHSAARALDLARAAASELARRPILTLAL